MSSEQIEQINLAIFDKFEFATPPELAESIRTDVSTVRDWCSRGILKAIDTRREGKKRPRWKISRQAWEDFARMRAGMAPTPRPRKRQNKAADLSEFFPQGVE